MKIAVLIARGILGLIFTVFGVNGFLNFIPIPELTPEGASFMGVLHDSGYLYVVKIIEIVGGVFLLAGRLVPLSITILGPVVINILLFHIFLDPGGLPMSIIVTAVWSFLLWAHRKHFEGLFAVKSNLPV
jgi:uncharacterized membrane protein YphA (DoxX/SURF4 family)